MTAAEFAPAVLQAGRDLGISPKGIVIGFATVYVESNWTMYANAKVPDSMNIPHEAVGSDGYSVGLFQQQVVNSGNGWWWGDAATCMDPYKSAQLFFSRLKRLDYNSGAQSPGSYAQAIQQSAFPDRYDQRMADAQALYDQISGGTVTTPPQDPRLTALQKVRPDFNELEFWCDNNQDRAGTKVDLWLIHTQEPGNLTDNDAALHLAQFLKSTEGSGNPVSYHYTIRQARDGGVTVYDIVDTDLASWSVGNSNNRAINACFAGSGVAWSRADWMTQAKAIDVAAYLAVQDCLKYGIDPNVIPGPQYGQNPPGISDHRYCSNWLKDGNNHDDVGDNFPWDVFSAAVAKYWAAANAGTTPPPADTGGDTTPADPFEAWVAGATDRQLLEYIVEQLGPGDPSWNSKGATLRDFLWSLQSQAKQTAAKAAGKRASRKSR
nr:N-acetylmuramoyl-L-alanine amidase [Mycobacterium intracellulare]